MNNPGIGVSLHNRSVGALDRKARSNCKEVTKSSLGMSLSQAAGHDLGSDQPTVSLSYCKSLRAGVTN